MMPPPVGQGHAVLGGKVALRSHGVRPKLRRKGHWLQGLEDFSTINIDRNMEKHFYFIFI